MFDTVSVERWTLDVGVGEAAGSYTSVAHVNLCERWQ